jgi:AraC-like DNA-binding protein
MPLTALNIILIIAASQGIFLASLIYFRHGKLFANRFLALYIFVYSLIIVDLLIWDLQLYQQRPYLRILLLVLPFILVPLHFLYAKYLTTSKQNFQRRDLLHFLPIFFVLGFFLLPQKGSRQALVQLLSFDETKELPLQFVIFNWTILLQTMVYLSLTLLLLQAYAKKIKDMFSTIDKVQLTWLRNLTAMMIAVAAFFLLENILFLLDVRLSEKFDLSSSVVAVSIYVIGYMGMGKSSIFMQPDVARSIKELSEIGDKESTQMKLPGKSQKYSKSGLSDDTAQAYLDELLLLMREEKPYRDSNLTLSQLAARLGITAHNLSQVLNAKRGQNFFDFINSYRVDDVIAGFRDPDKQHLKIIALAFDAGFNSKTTFNTIFKKITGKTPSEYRNTLS